MTVFINNHEYSAFTGDIVFYPCDIPHQESSGQSESLEIIYLDWEGPEINFPTIIHDKRGRVRILTEWLLSDNKNSMFSNQEMAEDNLMQALLYEIERNALTEVDTLIQNVKASIYENLSKKISLETLSEVFKMNKYTFLRKYKKLTGRTPMNEVKMIRIERARDLIISSDLTLKEIAERCGMTNEYNLSRVFQKTLNVPPGYFRKNH